MRGLEVTTAVADPAPRTLVPEADLVWTYITQADLAKAGASLAELDDLPARDVTALAAPHG